MRSEVAATRERQRRSYAQWCAIARAMDVVGERWTVLIVRDLLVGPKRYTDLLEGLPGIGTNLLAQRLRELEAEDLIAREQLPRPAAATVYRLTETGEGLRPVVSALGRWGFQLLARPRPTDAMLPDPFFLSLHASFRPEEAAREETYEFHVDDRVYSVAVAKGHVRIAQGPVPSPDAVISSDAGTLFALRRRELTPARAIANGSVKVTGARGALERFVAAFAWRKGAFAASPTLQI